LDEYLAQELQAPTPKSIVTPEQLIDELSNVRQRGYATNLEELEPGLAAIAAPIRDIHGQVIAAISVGGPVARLTEDDKPNSEMVQEVIAIAKAISGALGNRE
jgi:DNA-binding IclR family transcriptional regulator